MVTLFDAGDCALTTKLEPTATTLKVCAPVGVMPDAPALVFAAQANFLEGGLLLTVAIHHAAGDAVALQTILDTWAQNVSAAGGAEPLSASYGQTLNVCKATEHLP